MQHFVYERVEFLFTLEPGVNPDGLVFLVGVTAQSIDLLAIGSISTQRLKLYLPMFPEKLDTQGRDPFSRSNTSL